MLQQRDKYVHFKNLVRTCIEKHNRIKALEGKAVNFCSTV